VSQTANSTLRIIVFIMGWYLRKSFSFGPLRLNLSKSGLGYSFGVKGARIGTGPRGNYIHMGRYGLYYRQYFNPGTPGQDTRPNEPPKTPTEPVVTGTIIPTADVAGLQDSSAEELLNYIREQHRKPLVAPWVSAGAGILLVTMVAKGIAIWVVGLCLVLAVITHFIVSRFDAGRKRVVLRYRLDETMRTRYEGLSKALQALHSSQRAWRVITSDRSADTKYTAGAGVLINRRDAAIRMQAPPHIEVDLPVWSLDLAGQSLYFFPDRILVYQRGEVETVPYPELTAAHGLTTFVESDGVPSDARVVGMTWRYVNKGGGPDRRFANNPQIPVAEYAQIALHSKAGLNFLLQVSNVTASQTFAAGLSQYCSTISHAHVGEVSRSSVADGAEPSLKDSALQGWGWAAAPVLLTSILLALFFGPHDNLLQTLSSSTQNPTATIEKNLPQTRILRQTGAQIAMAVPAGTSDPDLLLLLQDLQSKVESSRFSELGINTAKGAIAQSGVTLFIFRADGAKIPRPLAQSDATLKLSLKGTTATVLKADGTRVPAFPTASSAAASTNGSSPTFAKGKRGSR
jgi:hypothetical protein